MNAFQTLVALAVMGHAAVVSPKELTALDALRTTRIMAGAPSFATLTTEGEFKNSGAPQIFVSPNNKLWAALLITGDLKKNGNWAEILVGNLQSLDTRPRVLARFFTHSLSDGEQGGAAGLTLAGSNPRPLQWLSDSRRVALLWTDDSDTNQIFVVDVSTGNSHQLSHHPTSIRSFTTHSDTIVYLADYSPPDRSVTASGPAPRSHSAGVTVETRYLPAVLRGELAGTFEGPYFKWFILDAHSGETKDIKGLVLNRFDWTGASFSADGRFAVVESSPDVVPASWDRYTEQFWSRMIRLARTNPNDLLGRQLMQHYVVDLRQGTAWALWDAPGKAGATVAWSPDGRAVALSPTFVPASHADDAGLSGSATAVVEIAGGRFHSIPTSASGSLAAASIRWINPRTIECRDLGEIYQYQEDAREWTKVPLTSPDIASPKRDEATVEVRVEEDMNTPPTIVATEPRTGKRRVIYDPNPDLKSRYSLGRVTMLEWKDADGRTWNGRLYFPVNWQAGHRYPLVIQTMGFAPSDVFSLYGGGPGDPGLGPGVTMSAAQPLASRGIMVLSAERKFLPELDETPEDARVHAAAYEAAIDHLDHMGFIDRKRVGISGYSNTGYLVLYALAHSAFTYGAAITDDNFDGSYYQAVTTGSKQYANENGAEPYGDGLKAWMQRAPAFNADKIRTPLRLQRTSPPPASILGAWEMFTRLRELNKPVELFLVPDIQRGSHVIQNPAQCLASQQGAVDWFDFWLNQREDAQPDKADQYERWRKLRALNTPHPIDTHSQSGR